MNTLWATVIIEECARLGISEFVIAPGSRSTPLTLAAAENKKISTTVHIDERGCGFFALGVAKATRKPVGIITTSGSAVANLLPAIVEAYQAHVPLVVLSADRPFELIGVAANQAINQPNIFGSFVHTSIALPHANPTTPLTAVLTKLDHALSLGGPVHINCPFQEPLIDEMPASLPDELQAWSQDTSPYMKITKPKAVTDIHKYIEGKKGCVLIGQVEPKARKAALAFAKKMNWETSPADVEVILQVGDFLVAKEELEFIKKSSAVLIKLQCHTHLSNATNQAQLVVEGDEYEIMKELAGDGDVEYETQSIDGFSEEAIFAAIAKSDYELFIGNSTPIRLFTKVTNRPAYSNRGASGIDGNLATSLGVAKGLEKPLLACVGDLTFLHDCNSLLMLKHLNTPYKLVVINNNGGKIFEWLDVKHQTQHFETFFKTPQNCDISAIAESFGLAAEKVSSMEGFESALASKNTTLIEIVID